MITIGDRYWLPLTRKKRIKTNPVTRVWYIDTWGKEVLEYINYAKIRKEPSLAIQASVYKIHKSYVELKLENGKIISVHYDYLDKLVKLL